MSEWEDLDIDQFDDDDDHEYVLSDEGMTTIAIWIGHMAFHGGYKLDTPGNISDTAGWLIASGLSDLSKDETAVLLSFAVPIWEFMNTPCDACGEVPIEADPECPGCGEDSV